MGTVRDIVESKGGTILGHTSTEGYEFEASKGLVEGDDSLFVGLCVDEDRQPELTNERVTNWCKQIHEEMCLAELEASPQVNKVFRLEGLIMQLCFSSAV